MSTRTGVVCGSAALAASVVTLFVAGISAVSPPPPSSASCCSPAGN